MDLEESTQEITDFMNQWSRSHTSSVLTLCRSPLFQLWSGREVERPSMLECMPTRMSAKNIPQEELVCRAGATLKDRSCGGIDSLLAVGPRLLLRSKCLLP